MLKKKIDGAWVLYKSTALLPMVAFKLASIDMASLLPRQKMDGARPCRHSSLAISVSSMTSSELLLSQQQLRVSTGIGLEEKQVVPSNMKKQNKKQG